MPQISTAEITPVPTPIPSPVCPRPDLITRLFLALINRRATRLTARGSKHPPRKPTSRDHLETLAQLRRIANRPSFPMKLSALPLRRVLSLRIPGATELRPARLYIPHGEVRGAVLFLHGGGYVHCGLNSHHGICCRLAHASGAAVLSFDYRLAPEAKFPAAFEDSWAALNWLASEAWRWGGKVAVAGDSAGGSLSAALAQRVRDQNRSIPATEKPKIDLALQVMFYPATHGLQDFPSRKAFGRGYFLTMGMLEWYALQYARTVADVASPQFSPGLEPDLKDLAPAVIITAGFDPLRDEAAAYAKALRQAGVPVTYACIPGTVHAFLNFYPVMWKGKRVLRLAGQALRKAFAH
ncbi:alpha/beta hydrolase [Acetobacter fallax]|uniref:Alpha/beta hydrolase fold domain-containing protein n=1 Tax=Acetobacter fallax TaxID=1737473 RepID=A0ABX0KCF5_9PROT|nr:alpha/beta hydrolase [Acetobacter fallax]NHO32190.1 alpha/beta hydrolase fold domain-containing protein [Acetobacter fallax]NHO35757.1 alpha/beta hydrolase fold domain-containing protein [Acetobacter fallax]